MTRPTCAWTEDTRDHAYWETECGGVFAVTEGTPTDNRMRFCPYCGGALVQITPTARDAGTEDENGK